MKKALVFRTAQTQVVYELIEKLERKNYKIWCVVQESALEGFKNKYPCVNCITVSDGFFDYKAFKAEKQLMKQIKRAKCGRVFIPSSTRSVNNFFEVRRIIYSLGFRKITYFFFNGESVTADISRSELYAEMIIKNERFIDFIVLLGNISSFTCYMKNRIFRNGG